MSLSAISWSEMIKYCDEYSLVGVHRELFISYLRAMDNEFLKYTDAKHSS